MSKKNYRVRNWKDDNQALVSRGSLTLWINEKSITQWQAKVRSGKRGRPLQYSDEAIICGLTLKAIF